MRGKSKRGKRRGSVVSKPKPKSKPNAVEMKAVKSSLCGHQIPMPKILKKRRIMRKRMSLNKLIELTRVIYDLGKRDCTTLSLAWMMNVKRERSNKTVRRQDFSYPFAEHILKEDEQCINHRRFQSDRFMIVYQRKGKRKDLNSAVEVTRQTMDSDVPNQLDHDQNNNAAVDSKTMDSDVPNQPDHDQNNNAAVDSKTMDSDVPNQPDHDQNNNAAVDSKTMDSDVPKVNAVSWAPLTPEIQSKREPLEKNSDSSVKTDCSGKTESLLDILKNKNENTQSTIPKRMKMKRHRPKVFDEMKCIKISTPNPRTPKRAKKAKKKADSLKNDDVKATHNSCKRKLDFNEEGCTSSPEELKSQDGIKSSLDPPKCKKRRMKRNRISMEKLVNLIGMISDVCDKRLKTSSYLDLNVSIQQEELPCNVLCTHGTETEIPEHSSEFMTKNVLLLQDEVLEEAMVDYIVQKMASLHIDYNASIQIVVSDSYKFGAIVSSKKKAGPSKKHKIMVDLDPESERVWNLLIGPNRTGSTNTEDFDDGEHMKGQRKLFRKKLDLFLTYMRVIQGDRQFSPWKGSVVDSIVGVFLTQNVSDSLSSSAYMDIASTYPPLSVSQQNSQFARDNQQLLLVEPPSSDPPLSVSEQNSQLVCDDQQLLLVEPPSSNRVGPDLEDRNEYSSQAAATPITKKKKGKEEQEEPINWDELKKEYSNNIPIKRTDHNADSVNWEAVRQSPDLAKVILKRGMNNQIAGKIKLFLDRLVKDHGSIDLEWLRNVPPSKAKDYLLSIYGIGLKSTECVRLLSLNSPAFPIDVNAARVFVRLGWVPIKPLPNGVQFHHLNNYPSMESVQKFLWPRICNLGPSKLYEIHCNVITFAKAFCTKSHPNCNHCPMRGGCKHYASAVASSRSRLEGDSSKMSSQEADQSSDSSKMSMSSQEAPMLKTFDGDQSHLQDSNEPFVELPPSPSPLGGDIEDIGCDPEIMPIPPNDDEEFSKKISNIEEITCDAKFPLNGEEFSGKFQSIVHVDDEISQSILTVRSPMPSLKESIRIKTTIRLRTIHLVYELPDSHHLLAAFKKREPEDPVPYLLAIWTTDETADSDIVCSSSQESTTTDARSYACSSGEVVPYEKHNFQETIQGTILIPYRTANGGRFPLNGTYFQTNEVFADHASSLQPICVPVSSIWNLRKRTLYCGTSITSICKGMSCLEIAYCFNRSFICIRGFDKETKATKSLKRRFHICKSRMTNK